MSPRPRPKNKKRPEEGLIGLFGHTYIDDRDWPGEKMIQCQFQIIRKMQGDRYVVQFFSFWDGGPTEVGVYPETELLGPSVKLYASEALWHEVYGEENRLWWERKRSS